MRHTTSDSSSHKGIAESLSLLAMSRSYPKDDYAEAQNPVDEDVGSLSGYSHNDPNEQRSETSSGRGDGREGGSVLNPAEQELLDEEAGKKLTPSACLGFESAL